MRIRNWSVKQKHYYRLSLVSPREMDSKFVLAISVLGQNGNVSRKMANGQYTY